MKPALMIIDIQNFYLTNIPELDKKIGLDYINGVIWMFRQKNFPVIRVYHTEQAYGPKPGTVEYEYPEFVFVQADDARIDKNFPNSFKNTELADMLQAKKIDTLFLCGLSATGCVLATYFGAMERDFNVFMIRDAIMSNNTAYTKVIEQICDTVSFKTLSIMLENV